MEQATNQGTGTMENITATRTMMGDSTHARHAGSDKTLCGRKAFGTMNSPHSVEEQVTCQKCRRAAGMSYIVYKGSRTIHMPAKN